VVGAVVDGEGRPICTEIWPGNTADVKSLIPVVTRMKTRFGIRVVCIVADRGMISKETIKALESEELSLLYILGARMRRQNEVKNESQAKKDAADRDAIVESLRQKLRQGEKSLVGNNGYRKYLKSLFRSIKSILETRITTISSAVRLMTSLW